MGTYNKYGNTPIVIDNQRFPSKKEGNRYIELRALLKAGALRSLELQPRYDLIVNGVNCGYYKADFRYVFNDGSEIVEDVKGKKTAVYELKKKLVKALYGFDIYET